MLSGIFFTDLFRHAADLSFPEQVALSLRWADAENCARMKLR